MFQGNVYQTKAIKDATRDDIALDDVIKAFMDYWATGFNPNIGRDEITARPNPPPGHRHVHILPFHFPDDSSSDSSVNATFNHKQWRNWASQKKLRNEYIRKDRIPTSDACLFYFVDTKRNAYIFHVQFEGAHAYMDSSEFNALVEKVSYSVEASGTHLMSWQDQQTLFADKWQRHIKP